MTGSLFCSNCGTAYNPKNDFYCTKCGMKFSSGGAKKKLLDDIKAIEDTPPTYETMRVVAGIIIAFGWMVIIFGWGFSLFVGTVFGDSVRNLASDGSSLKNITSLITAISGVFFSIQGLFMIAFGQAITVFLDIRTDTNLTKRLIRRFGLLMMDNQKPQE